MLAQLSKSAGTGWPLFLLHDWPNLLASSSYAQGKLPGAHVPVYSLHDNNGVSLVVNRSSSSDRLFFTSEPSPTATREEENLDGKTAFEVKQERRKTKKDQNLPHHVPVGQDDPFEFKCQGNENPVDNKVVDILKGF
jgi:hypothetical protein